MFESRSPYETYSQAIVRSSPQPQQQLAPYPVYRQPSVWDTYREMLAPPQAPCTPTESAVIGLRHNGEGMAIAALLAFVQRHTGTLDFQGKYPADGILAAILFGLSIKEAAKPDGYAGDLRALSQSCSTVYMYRKVLGSSSEPKTESTPQVSGTIPRNISDDPIIQAAQAAGF